MNRALVALSLPLALTGCSVQFLSGNAVDAVQNTCSTDADCGANASCTDGACFAKSGVIDEVLLEIIPDANSSSGGLSFLIMQSGLQNGARHTTLELAGQNPFITQVLANGADLPASCPYVATGKQTIQSHIEFIRTGAVGGVPILGLTNVAVTADTMLRAGVWNAPTSLASGMYDVYIQPAAIAGCDIAPRILRGIDVGSLLDPSAPPATLELPMPATLLGKVQRTDDTGTLEGWQVDIIEPQEGRVISTSARLGPTDPMSPVTNFSISYQKLAAPLTATVTDGAAMAGPLIRISPPTPMVDKAPTLYWDLASADLAGDGHCSLDMSRLPVTPDRLVTVSGQVHGATDGVRSNLQFSSLSLAAATGLTASFKKSVTTDDAGNYTTDLFPGQYRVVVIPVGSTSDTQITPPTMPDGTPAPMGAAARPWSIYEQEWAVTTQQQQVLPVYLSAKRSVEGFAYGGPTGSIPAVGATLEATPAIVASQVSAVRSALARVPVLPQDASVGVRSDGHFSLPLDPGDFDLSLQAPESSNFAWWVWPAAHVAAPQLDSAIPRQIARLPFPVPLEGVITVPDATGPRPLRGAAVRAYAKVPMGTGVAKVGDTRTDDTGHYLLHLPPNFAP